jgi:hypothetical protein
MPHLVYGHLRYTAADYLYSDYKLKIQEMTKNISKKETKSKIKSVKTLVSSIKYRLDDVQGMSYYIKDDEEVTERINTQMKKELIETLDSLLILANKLGYSLEDLIQ